MPCNPLKNSMLTYHFNDKIVKNYTPTCDIISEYLILFCAIKRQNKSNFEIKNKLSNISL